MDSNLQYLKSTARFEVRNKIYEDTITTEIPQLPYKFRWWQGYPGRISITVLGNSWLVQTFGPHLCTVHFPINTIYSEILYSKEALPRSWLS